MDTTKVEAIISDMLYTIKTSETAYKERIRLLEERYESRISSLMGRVKELELIKHAFIALMDACSLKFPHTITVGKHGIEVAKERDMEIEFDVNDVIFKVINKS